MSRLTVVLVALLAVVSMASAVTVSENMFYDGTQGEPKELFAQWMHTHKMSFSSEDFVARFNAFNANLELVAKLNKEHHPKTSFGINKFAHLTQKEFANQFLMKNPIKPRKNLNAKHVPIKDIPEAFDWADKDKNVVLPVKNQGSCGSCWAFSAVGALESVNAIKNKTLVNLSEQHLVDCDQTCFIYEGQEVCNSGCNGGFMETAYMFIMKNKGVATQQSYPYTGRDDQCKTNYDVGATLTSYENLGPNEAEMAQVLYERGPIAIAADATMWQFYFGGIFYLPCGTSLNHGIVLTGYGQDTTIFQQKMDYWIVRNSWGTGWGKGGNIWIQRGVGKCGVNLYPTIPIV